MLPLQTGQLTNPRLQKKPLLLTPSNLIEARTYPTFLQHLHTTYPTLLFHPTYTDFSAIVSKSGALTLRDVFLKFLMVNRGISVEKAAEIQKLYATPKALVEAYEELGTDKERIEMLMRALEGRVGRKKLGAAASGKVAEVWAGVIFDGDWR